MRLICLFLVASGMLWGNVVFCYFWNYAVTLKLVFIFIIFSLGTIDWLKARRIRNRLLKPVLFLILYEISIHGFLGGNILEQEWLKSFALLIMCTGLIIVSIKFQISKQQLPRFATFVSWIAYILGGLGITQFIFAYAFGYFFRPLPNIMALGTTNVELDAQRFFGLSRAVGISSEPSYYGVGMVVITTLCMVLIYLIPPDHYRSRVFRYGALLVSVAGVAVSASLAAWGLLIIVLLGFFLCRLNGVKKRQTAFFPIFIVIIFAAILIWPFLQARVESVFTNPDDRGVNYRLRAAIDLMLSPSNDLVSNLLGAGVGMDGNVSQVEDTFSNYFSHDQLRMIRSDRTNVVIVSAWAYVAVTMGWVGLALNVWLLLAVFGQRHGWPFPSLPLILLCVGYLFAIGNYLSPEWWAVLVLSAFLTNMQKERGIVHLYGRPLYIVVMG